MQETKHIGKGILSGLIAIFVVMVTCVAHAYIHKYAGIII